MTDLLSFLLWAHGADPRPIRIDEASANLVKFFVTILIALVMTYPVLAPLFPKKARDAEAPAEASEANSGVVGWVALGLLLVLSMAWWLTRTSIVELNAQETPIADHAHVQERGGQVAMWGDFHAEVARIESGEVRVYLTDSYNRPISARFFEAEVAPVKAGTGANSEPTAEPKPTISALDDSYRFALLGQEARAYRVKVSTPGWSVKLKFEFDNERGRRSLPLWCGTPESTSGE